MKKEYSLIKDNIIIEMFYTDDIEKIKQQPEYSEDCEIVEKEDWHCKGLNILRYQNGVLLTNKASIEQGLIVLKENEVLIYDNIIELEDTQKVVDNKIVEKSIEEKYVDGIIGDIEYNEQIVSNRIGMYINQIDTLFMEFMQEYFSNIELPKELKEKFDFILEKKQSIKKEYPKTTSDNFKQSLIEKLNIDIESLDNLIVKGVNNGKRKTK